MAKNFYTEAASSEIGQTKSFFYSKVQGCKKLGIYLALPI